MRILVIEDELKTSAYLKKGLEESGYLVDVATDGGSGLGLAQEEDVIGSFANGIEGERAVILVKFETPVRREHGGPNSPAHVEQQAPCNVV